MASLLTYGGGAYSGLEDILDRQYKQLVEDRLSAAQQEVARHNKASESYQLENLKETSALRTAQEKATEEDRQARLAAGLRDDYRLRAGMRNEGDVVSPEERAQEVQSNAVPTSRYKQTGSYQGMSGDDASEPIGQDEFRWIGVKPKTETSMQDKTVLYKGKPTDVGWDPKTNKFFLPGGTDITSEVSHYEKPPAPDRVMVWTDQGLIPRTTAAQAARGGTPAQPQATSQTRSMSEGAKMLQPHIDDVKSQAEELDKAGLFGPVMSRVREGLAKAGSVDDFASFLLTDPQLKQDRRVGNFATQLGLLASGAGRVHGGARGGGSPQMVQYMKNMLGDASSLDMFLGRMDALDDYMSGYAAGPGGHDSSSSGGVPQVGGTFQGGKVLKVTPIP